MGWGDSKITHSLQEFRGLNELCKYQDTAEHISKSEHHMRAGYYSDSFSFSRGMALCCMLEVQTWKSHSCPQGACRQVKEQGSWSSSYSPTWLVSRTRMMNNKGGMQRLVLKPNCTRELFGGRRGVRCLRSSPGYLIRVPKAELAICM